MLNLNNFLWNLLVEIGPFRVNVMSWVQLSLLLCIRNSNVLVHPYWFNLNKILLSGKVWVHVLVSGELISDSGPLYFILCWWYSFFLLIYRRFLLQEFPSITFLWSMFFRLCISCNIKLSVVLMWISDSCVIVTFPWIWYGGFMYMVAIHVSWVPVF